ncbi:MAG: PQQ-binding-like beta-propeller repeat protein [Planctomycetota bacterium]
MKRQTNQFRAALVSFSVILGICSVLTAQPLTPGQQAERILRECEVKGGLVVHLGCRDGTLTAALRRGQSYLVHGLDADAEDIQRAREVIRSAGLYGPVSVEQWEGPRLPYGDNIVNLLIAEELGRVPMREVMRVLAPCGAAYVKRGNTWRKEVKPRPADIDEWTHYLHDASGNAVAHDQVVGPPNYMQWLAEPRHTRSHEHTPGISALVSTKGRIFYIADEAPVGSIRRPAQWNLVARDAYNGILLWQRPIATWFPHIVNWGQVPGQLQRKLVAVGDCVYVTAGLHAPLTAVDAATGDVLRTYENTEGSEEIIYHRGILILAVRSVTDERRSELVKWAGLSRADDSPLYVRESAEPLVSRFRGIEAKAPITLMALDADTSRRLWQKEGADTAGLRALTLCADGDRVFYQKGKEIVCLNLKSGQQLWSQSSFGPLRVVYDGNIFCADGKAVTALSAQTGKSLWTQTPLLCDIRDVFVANGSLWLGGFKPFPTKRGPSWGPYFATQRDLATGKMLMHIEPENPEHHHRCYANKATDRFILGGRRGVEFFDLESGDVRWHSWVRGVCKYGVMPCNGLLYAPPDACGCYVGTKMTGFAALAAGQQSLDAGIVPEQTQLFSAAGPAVASTGPGEGDFDEWPAYRHDAQRSGCTDSRVGADLKLKWQRALGEGLTSLTAAEDKVFVACRDRHKVVAVEGDTGTTAWTFTAGGRVDSPPTIHRGLALFGSRDGRAYCLNASDGSLVWRFQGSAVPRRIVASGQLESASPVHGSVLLQNNAAYFTTGRSSYLDGGIDLYRLDPVTGKTLSKTRVYSPDPETGKQPPQFAPYSMPGVRSDILTGDGEYVYLRDMVFDRGGTARAEGNSHLFTLTDFLDDSWAHRSYWILGTHCSLSTGCSRRDKDLVSGRLLVFDASTIYGYGRKSYHWSNQLQDGPYVLFARGQGQSESKWAKSVPLQVRAMVLADRVLFAAGFPMDPNDGQDSGGEAKDGLLLAVDAFDGATLAQYRLEAPPVFDGMAAIRGRLYMTLENGSVVCMEGRQRSATFSKSLP